MEAAKELGSGHGDGVLREEKRYEEETAIKVELISSSSSSSFHVNFLEILLWI